VGAQFRSGLSYLQALQIWRSALQLHRRYNVVTNEDNPARNDYADKLLTVSLHQMVWSSYSAFQRRSSLASPYTFTWSKREELQRG